MRLFLTWWYINHKSAFLLAQSNQRLLWKALIKRWTNLLGMKVLVQLAAYKSTTFGEKVIGLCAIWVNNPMLKVNIHDLLHPPRKKGRLSIIEMQMALKSNWYLNDYTKEVALTHFSAHTLLESKLINRYVSWYCTGRTTLLMVITNKIRKTRLGLLSLQFFAVVPK